MDISPLLSMLKTNMNIQTLGVYKICYDLKHQRQKCEEVVEEERFPIRPYNDFSTGIPKLASLTCNDCTEIFRRNNSLFKVWKESKSNKYRKSKPDKAGLQAHDIQ